jgi:hypothetical protein
MLKDILVKRLQGERKKTFLEKLWFLVPDPWTLQDSLDFDDLPWRRPRGQLFHP